MSRIECRSAADGRPTYRILSRRPGRRMAGSMISAGRQTEGMPGTSHNTYRWLKALEKWAETPSLHQINTHNSHTTSTLNDFHLKLIKKSNTEHLRGAKQEQRPVHRGSEPVHRGSDPVHKGSELVVRGSDPVHRGSEPGVLVSGRDGMWTAAGQSVAPEAQLGGSSCWMP